MMIKFYSAMLMMAIALPALAANSDVKADLVVRFSEPLAQRLDVDERTKIIAEAEHITVHTRKIFPALNQPLSLEFHTISQELEAMNGVTGYSAKVGEMTIEITRGTAEEMVGRIHNNLERVLYRELHRQMRRWTMQQLQIQPGLDLVAVNEGLALVYSEIMSRNHWDALQYDDDIEAWYRDIGALPKNANDSHWIDKHPDGRRYVVYKVGRFIVHQALGATGKNIIELSALTAPQILDAVDGKLAPATKGEAVNSGD